MAKKKRSKDPIVQLQTKLTKAKQSLHGLLRENDHAELYNHYRNYNSTKNPSYKKLHSRYNRWHYINKKILKL